MKKINLVMLFASIGLLASCGQSSTPGSTDEPTNPTSTEPTSEPLPAFVGIKTVDEAGEEVVLQPVEGAYTIENNVDDQQYHVYGEIHEAIIFSETSTLSAKLCLHNATIVNDEVSPIQWLAESKKVKVVASEGENAITCTAEGIDAITSNNNCDIQGSAKLTITANGTAVKASSVAVEGSGTYDIVSSAKNGISCKELVLGDEDPAAASEHTFALTVEASGTAIKAEMNSKGKKGTILDNHNGKVTVKNAQTGVFAESSATILSGVIDAVDCAVSYDIASFTEDSVNVENTLLVNGQASK